MVRSGPSKPVGGGEWRGRLANAKSFHRAAEHLLDLWEEGDNGNPVVVLLVLAAIGFGDTLAARFGGRVNKQDHAALPATIRAAMGNRADEQQLSRLRRILEEKDAASYGARIGRMDHARDLHVQLQRFASWVEVVIREG
jgi:hypothetical protein